MRISHDICVRFGRYMRSQYGYMRLLGELYAFHSIYAPPIWIYASIRRFHLPPGHYRHPYHGCSPPTRPSPRSSLSLPLRRLDSNTHSMSTDPESRTNFGPFLSHVGPTYVDPSSSEPEGLKTIRYGVIGDLERALELEGKDVAAVLMEPIQGEAG